MMSNLTGGWGKKPTASTATPELKAAVKTSKSKKLTFDIPEELHQKFKIFAAKQNTTMAQLINTFIQQAVKL
jgi:predicted HicB family RNase H-like nuclease